MRLGEIVEISRGASPRPIQQFITFSENGIPWIKIGDTELGGKYIYSTKEKITPSGADLSKKVEINDFLLTNSMSFGRPYITKISGCVHDGWLVIKFNEKVFNIDFLYYLLSSPFAFSQFSKKAAGSAFKNLKSDTVRESLIALPPLNEQHRIVAKIEELLPFIDQYDQKEQALTALNKNFPDQLKKSILQAAIQGKLTEQLPTDEPASLLIQRIQAEKELLIADKKLKKPKVRSQIVVRDNLPYEIVDGVERCIQDEVPFEIPESWVWVRLGEIVILNPKNKIDDNIEVSFIPMNLINDEYKNSHSYHIKLWKEIKSGFTHFSENDLAVAKITPCFENRKSVVLRNLYQGYGAGTTEIFIIRPINKDIDVNYLLWFVKSHYFIDNGVKSYTGTAGQQRISSDYIRNCLIPIPPIEEQKRIVEKIELLLNNIEKLN